MSWLTLGSGISPQPPDLWVGYPFLWQETFIALACSIQ